MKRATPSGRLLAAVLVVAAVATAPIASVPGLALAFGVAALAVALGRPRPILVGLALLPLAGALGATLAPQVAAAQGDRAVRTAVRAVLAVVTAVSVLGSFGRHELPGALRGLGAPAALAGVVAAILQQARIVADEASRLLLARRLRGASGGLLGPDLLAALLRRATSRAERVELGMRLRGWAGVARGPGPGARDALLVAAAAGLVALVQGAAALGTR